MVRLEKLQILKRLHFRVYDYVVVGGGVAGCSIAYFLSIEGKKVALIEQDTICSKASGAAGAFINPTMGKPSNLKTISDQAFLFSTEYFSKHFSDIFWRCGTYLLPKIEKTKAEFEALADYVPFGCEYIDENNIDFIKRPTRNFGAYFCKSAGIVQPTEFCNRLIQRCDVFENQKVEKIEKVDNGFVLCGLSSEAVIIATGANKELLGEEYLISSIIGLWGQKIEVRSNFESEYNISGDVLVSAVKNGKFAIGATYVRSEKELELSDEISKMLLASAKEIIDIGTCEVVSAKGGLRATSIDHFPIVGRIIDMQENLEKYPFLVNGRRLYSEQIMYKDNMFVFTGHTSKAFSVAFYTAKLFADSILRGSDLSASINSDRLFFRWCRKHKRL